MTPGPWNLRPMSGQRNQWVISAGNYAIASVGGDESDARLIAAAPDMLTALKAMLEADRDSILLAIAAINKAEGRDP